MYKSDEEKMMSDPNIKWSKSSVIKKESEDNKMTKDLKYNEDYVLLNVAARGYIKKINDDLFDFYNQPYMAFIPAKRRVQFKAIMTKLVELEPSSKDLKELEQPKKSKPIQLSFGF